MNNEQRPTISRSSRIVETATDKGYTPITEPDATLSLDNLATIVMIVGPVDLSPDNLTRLRMYCAAYNLPFREVVTYLQTANRLAQ